MAVKICTFQVAASTGGGNQDITYSGFGATVKAAIITTSATTSNDSLTGYQFMSFGFYANEQNYAFSGYDKDAVGTMVSTRHFSNTACVFVRLDSTVTALGGVTSVITDGIRINWATTPASAYLLTVTLIGGNEVLATTAVASLASGSVTGIGFRPDLIIAAATVTGGTATNNIMSVGWAGRGSSILQGCVTTRSRSAVATSEKCGQVRDDSFAMRSKDWDGTVTWRLSLSSFDSDGWTQSLEGSGSDSVYCLVLKLGSCRLSGGIYSTPTGTGSSTISVDGFKTPQYAFILASLAAATNTAYTDDSVAGNFIIQACRNNKFYNCGQGKDNVGTSVSKSLSSTGTATLAQGTTNVLVATMTGLNRDGFAMNFTTASGTARQWPWIMIEADPSEYQEAVCRGVAYGVGRGIA